MRVRDWPVHWGRVKISQAALLEKERGRTVLVHSLPPQAVQSTPPPPEKIHPVEQNNTGSAINWGKNREICTTTSLV